MNTECFCVDRIPDLTLAKYSAQEGGMQKDVLKQQMLFHRQMNRRGLLFDTFYRFIVLYQADGKPGSRLRFYLSTDAKEKEISVEKILRSSQLSVYYHFEQCEAPDLSKLSCSAMIVKHSNILLDSEGRPSYYVVDEWKMNEAARLISLFRMMAALEQDCAYEVELRPCKLAEEERSRLEELVGMGLHGLLVVIDDFQQLFFVSVEELGVVEYLLKVFTTCLVGVLENVFPERLHKPDDVPCLVFVDFVDDVFHDPGEDKVLVFERVDHLVHGLLFHLLVVQFDAEVGGEVEFAGEVPEDALEELVDGLHPE